MSQQELENTSFRLVQYLLPFILKLERMEMTSLYRGTHRNYAEHESNMIEGSIVVNLRDLGVDFLSLKAMYGSIKRYMYNVHKPHFHCSVYVSGAQRFLKSHCGFSWCRCE